MAVYSTEPGVRVTRNDLGVRPTVSDPGTDTVLVIGLAVDGPNDTAVSIRSLEEATRIFGPTHKCTELGYDSRVKVSMETLWFGRFVRCGRVVPDRSSPGVLAEPTLRLP